MRALLPRTPTSIAFTALLALSAGVFYVSYRAVSEWRRNAHAVATGRAGAAANLLATALMRDMRAVQLRMRPSGVSEVDLLSPRPELLEEVTSTLAKYPYPDTFFLVDIGPVPSVLFFARSDRYPSWMPAAARSTRLPVAVGSAPAIGTRLAERVRRDAASSRAFSVFDIEIAGRTHQAVAGIRYSDGFRERPEVAIGFLVDLAWVREHYFREVLRQVERIPAAGTGLALSVVDSTGTALAGPARAQTAPGNARAALPLLFFDPALVELDPPVDLRNERLAVHTDIASDPALAVANTSAQRALSSATAMLLVLIAGMVTIVKATRTTVRLAQLKADFMATVTHELKTPLATLQAISETFTHDRGITPEVTRRHGRLALHETKRLRRLIDNLLAYTRITDVTEAYSFEAVTVEALCLRSLGDFTSQLEYGGFSVSVNIPADLPRIKADTTAMGMALGNLLDNAIRYSGSARELWVRAWLSDARTVTIEVVDGGVGIPADEVPHITGKFFRGRHSAAGGTGLGLAIVDRIVADHGGSIAFESTLGKGTAVRVTVPVAAEAV